MKRAAYLLAAALAVTSSFALANDRSGIDDAPSATAIAADLLLVRPVSLVATVVGVGLFVLQLPLSVIQGEPPVEPAKQLVVQPAKFTFTRRLGRNDYSDIR